MPFALVKPKPRVRVPARMKAAGMPSNKGAAPAGARLMDYFGIGAQVAMMPGGMMLAVQADHLIETVRVGDIWNWTGEPIDA